MSLVDGFERYEGLGVFGASTLPMPLEVVVNISPHAIEIKDFHDAPVAMWLPSAITDNGRAHHEKRYYPIGDDSEWLAVEDAELAHYLNAFVTQNRAAEQKTRPLPPPTRYAALFTALAVICLLLFFVFKLPDVMARLTANQISSEVKQKLDHAFEEILIEPFTYCNAEEAARAKRAIVKSSSTEPLDFDIVKGLPEPALRLPSGRLLIDQSTLLGLPDDRDLRGLLLIETLRETHEATALRVLIDEAGSLKMFNWLRTNGISADNLRPYIDAYRARVSPKKADYEFAINLDESAAESAYFQLYDIAPRDGVEPVLTDQAWVALGALCSDE